MLWLGVNDRRTPVSAWPRGWVRKEMAPEQTPPPPSQTTEQAPQSPEQASQLPLVTGASPEQASQLPVLATHASPQDVQVPTQATQSPDQTAQVTRRIGTSVGILQASLGSELSSLLWIIIYKFKYELILSASSLMSTKRFTLAGNYVVLFSASEQTHCALVISDWMSDCNFTQHVFEYPLKWHTYSAVSLLNGWFHMELLPPRLLFCIHSFPMSLCSLRFIYSLP